MIDDTLTLLVMHYRTPDVLRTCLAKLEAFAPGARVIVVDSSPPDETPSVKTELVKVPNHSFAYMVNYGLKHVTTPYAAHLNADVFLEPDTLPQLFRGRAAPRRRDGWANRENAGR